MSVRDLHRGRIDAGVEGRIDRRVDRRRASDPRKGAAVHSEPMADRGTSSPGPPTVPGLTTAPGEDASQLAPPGTDRILTIPNVISLVRLSCIPLFQWLLFGADDRS